MIAIIAPLPAGTQNKSYSQTLGAEGGVSPYTWSTAIEQGQSGLPPGVSLSSSGVLSGTPTASGLFTCTLKVLDSSGTPGYIVSSITIL